MTCNVLQLFNILNNFVGILCNNTEKMLKCSEYDAIWFGYQHPINGNHYD